MRLLSPLECLSSSINHAAYLALPNLEYEDRDWAVLRTWPEEKQRAARQGKAEFPMVKCVRRPSADECEVVAMFPQTWGSTALGFGGIGGAAMTPAYTVVVRGPAGQEAVYWHGKFAYVVDPRTQTEEQRQLWLEDVARRCTASRVEALRRYGASAEPFVVL